MIENNNPTTVNRYFNWIINTVKSDSLLYKTAESYLKADEESNETSNGPFLTVLTRTQGKRLQMLNEVLLCLTGQSNTDFEVLVMGHNLDDKQTEDVLELIQQLPLSMREKVRLIQVKGGNRSTPLNKGFAEAKGKYVSILDDDDLVLENWVETFYNLYLENSGKILHAYSVWQNWKLTNTEAGETLMSASTFNDVYCKNFLLLDQISRNYCPTMSLAFPTRVYKEWGIKFDEKLDTTEDWHFLMRAAFLCGTADAEVVTSIYRIWENAENSQSLHNKKIWDINYKKIVDYFTETPIVLDKPSIEKFLKVYGNKNILYDRFYKETRLFYDVGNGFSETNTINTLSDQTSDTETATFDLSSCKDKITKIRIDPGESGGVLLENFGLKVVFEDDSEENYDLNNIITNGIITKNKIAFIKRDPQIVVKFNTPKIIKKVHFKFMMYDYIPDKIVDNILFSPSKFIVRCAKKVIHLLKSILRVG